MGKKASQAQEFFHSLENNLESDIGIGTTSHYLDYLLLEELFVDALVFS